MNTVYLVIQQSVYRHKIMGAYTTIPQAKEAIEQYINGSGPKNGAFWGDDDDGHHCYEICKLKVGVKITCNSDAVRVEEMERPYSKKQDTKYEWVEKTIEPSQREVSNDNEVPF